MTIGGKIRLLRKEANLSQEELGEKLNISRQSISKWELDVSTPDLENLIELADVFNISVDLLVGREAEINAGEKGQGNKMGLIVFYGIPVLINIVAIIVFIYGFRKDLIFLRLGSLLGLSSLVFIYLIYKYRILDVGEDDFKLNLKYNMYLDLILILYLGRLTSRTVNYLLYKVYGKIEFIVFERLRIKYKLKSIYTAKNYLYPEILTSAYSRVDLMYRSFEFIIFLVVLLFAYYLVNKLIEKL